MRITSKGQVTIPIGKAVRLRPAKASRQRGRGGTAVERLRGSATVRMTTEEILALTRNK
jgi:hypothetical protein